MSLRQHVLSSASHALQWRLLLLWVLALLLPALLAVLPLGLALGELLNRSLAGARLVEGFDAAVLLDAFAALREHGWSAASALPGLVVFVLLLPWLSGLALTAARTTERLGFGALVRGGVAEYARMARLWLWALLPLLIAAGLGGALMKGIGTQVQKMTLESDALWLGRAGIAFSALLFLLAHATVDAARAQLVIEPRRRSVIAAWWRGTRTLLKRPRNLLLYGLVTLAGLLIAAAIGLARIQVAPVGAAGFVAAVLLSQLLVAGLAWMRCARLVALVSAGRRQP